LLLQARTTRRFVATVVEALRECQQHQQAAQRCGTALQRADKQEQALQMLRRTMCWLVVAARTRALSTSPRRLADVFRERLLFEDNHVLVVDKPAGMLSQGDRTGDACVNEHAKAYLAETRNTKFAAAAHRLDRPVSGCLAVAATSKAAARLSKAFAKGTVDKRYLAVVAAAADFKRGARACLVDATRTRDDGRARKAEVRRLAVLEEWAPGEAKRRAAEAAALGAGWKLAATEYRVLATAGGAALVEVALRDSGRRHQIRAALSHAGAPILGDAKYGPAGGGGVAPFVALHAATLTTKHPVADRDPIAVAAPVPAAWREICAPALFDAAEKYVAEAVRR